jgi:hypothetical protein
MHLTKRLIVATTNLTGPIEPYNYIVRKYHLIESLSATWKYLIPYIIVVHEYHLTKSLKVDEKVGSGFATRTINMEKHLGEKNLNKNFHLEA